MSSGNAIRQKVADAQDDERDAVAAEATVGPTMALETQVTIDDGVAGPPRDALPR